DRTTRGSRPSATAGRRAGGARDVAEGRRRDSDSMWPNRANASRLSPSRSADRAAGRARDAIPHSRPGRRDPMFQPPAPLALRAVAALACLVAPRVHASTTETGPTKMLRSPTVSATQIAFAYAQNIWIVDRSGGAARRLTSFQGQASNPHFSPDGNWIAFSGEYAGNLDVYVVGASGGEPRRLTWHPVADDVPGWTPDRPSVVFPP